MSAAYNPYYDPTNRPLGKTPIRFSPLELQHLAVAVIGLTVGVGLVLTSEDTVLGRLTAFFTDPLNLVAAFLAVASGFVLHELAHKFVAIRYGCMAEFRAQLSGLVLAIVFALLIGWIVALPGAVQIYGQVDRKENGIISIAGPATNLAIALVSLPVIIFASGAVEEVFFVVGVVNAFLAAFNLLPFWNLDGKKVMQWHPVLWGASLALAVGLTFAAFFATKLAL